ncbi:hypothetical protein FHR81_002433 [Actinoalloteichus hoggarensis]|uniref:Uncharacterized protein n=1 Tax=Actinoalloteichus hoggarensis TaxID=1470176 RepID=A0A221VWW0_9PSEU|nr:hypothetical protein AHOG_01875 [Actinoalloteichus hoggarensis]MBB5921393.1 hypothetical protein [Actinoalloteichus hoggarensis]
MARTAMAERQPNDGGDIAELPSDRVKTLDAAPARTTTMDHRP